MSKKSHFEDGAMVWRYVGFVLAEESECYGGCLCMLCVCLWSGMSSSISVICRERGMKLDVEPRIEHLRQVLNVIVFKTTALDQHLEDVKGGKRCHGGR